MKKALIITGVLVAALFAFIAYSGLFYSVTITEKEMGPFTMILKKHAGSYYKTGAVFNEVEAALKKNMDTKKLKAVGLYYDDPDKVKEEELRSECGFIIEKGDMAKIGALESGLFIKEFEKTSCAVGEFPLKSFLSYMMGPSKAYPALASYIKGKKISGDFGMEIYDLQSKKIFYCMPVGRVE
ncbi:MAG TPA: GyrI-like domain-containing protein [Spirochaetota bacterium]|nr:GyrI-like domain-containing protein [Spirochaetota bacterium]HOD14766.1 GyrI-like domain-containing protein [Spirochaetota bacterium]HPG49090.1 GyrI-like domain-containing protein [Spirochaetota bacterium]HPN14154.1 GyrI-like domain-containing protein [Spirochaetota bacterium]HQL82645.1 GyrI-like domain-containing protein [Spirochaetota bacterium]